MGSACSDTPVTPSLQYRCYGHMDAATVAPQLSVIKELACVLEAL